MIVFSALDKFMSFFLQTLSPYFLVAFVLGFLFLLNVPNRNQEEKNYLELNKYYNFDVSYVSITDVITI